MNGVNHQGFQDMTDRILDILKKYNETNIIQTTVRRITHKKRREDGGEK